MGDTHERQEDVLVDLGTIEDETKGDVGLIQDTANGRQPFAGLSDE